MHKSRTPIKIPVHSTSRMQAGFGHGGCPVHGTVRPVLSAGRCMHSPQRSYACPCFVQSQKYQPTKSYENSSNSDAYYTSTSSSESSVERADHRGVKIIPVQQKRSRSHLANKVYCDDGTPTIMLRFRSLDNNGSVSPFRARTTLPTDRPVALIRAREPSPKQQTRPSRGQNVTIVYGDRPKRRNSQEKGHRRTKSAAQPTVRVGKDYSPTRINGASKILYATEPETSNYPNVQISRPSYMTSDDRRDVAAVTTTESSSTDAYPNHKPPYGFTADSQLPERRNINHDNAKRNGENGMRFESIKPSGIPYFGQFAVIIEKLIDSILHS
nr:hypothetical transcript [Hymenolepis microstoma]